MRGQQKLRESSVPLEVFLARYPRIVGLTYERVKITDDTAPTPIYNASAVEGAMGYVREVQDLNRRRATANAIVEALISEGLIS